MSVFEIILISIGLAMDAFGVSIGKGLTMPVGENGRKVTLAFLPINVWEASTMIGVITFGISLIGVYLGKFMGQFVGKYADILGGGVLILIGTKILLQHLGIIGEF